MKFFAITLYRKIKRVINVLSGKDSFYRVSRKLNLEFHGNEYGGWSIVKDSLSKDSIIYSFGIGTDISFDLSIINKYGSVVYAFDPTPKSIEWLKKQDLPNEFKYFEFGISNKDGVENFYIPVDTSYVSHSSVQNKAFQTSFITVNVNKLSTIMKNNQHTSLDLLKMDIEGAEYDVVDDILSSNVEVSQLLVEFHHRFSSIGTKKTKLAIDKLKENGYSLNSVSENGEEFLFVKE